MHSCVCMGYMLVIIITHIKYVANLENLGPQIIITRMKYAANYPISLRKSRTTIFFRDFKITFIWKTVNNKDKIVGSCENDRQLLSTCHIKVMAKNSCGSRTTPFVPPFFFLLLERFFFGGLGWKTPWNHQLFPLSLFHCYQIMEIVVLFPLFFSSFSIHQLFTSTKHSVSYHRFKVV